ncbi:hypothetical protein L2E82_31681 [Cichorium intybus]|uniref:Uncharacterized protein n=1 Tax=Cichorium intybus TaxID=13427 RepID=A0ACB9BFF0_CICIN|nr:hypothetical protein L2E82_31681 [Cichorium intybus]
MRRLQQFCRSIDHCEYPLQIHLSPHPSLFLNRQASSLCIALSTTARLLIEPFSQLTNDGIGLSIICQISLQIDPCCFSFEFFVKILKVEQLYVDQNLSSCYEFVKQSCLLILNHLSAMDKQRECPEEYKEVISTLMFAAARFAYLPELRELRSLFSERYGNCLEPYVNKELLNMFFFNKSISY